MVKLALGIAIGYVFSDFIDDLLDRTTLVKSDKKSESGGVTYQRMPGERASTKHPATGADLPPERVEAINNSTAEAPVWVTQEEMAKMEQLYLQVALGAGRLKIVGYHEEQS